MFTFISLGFYLRGYLINISDITQNMNVQNQRKKKKVYFHANFSLVIKIMFLRRKFYLQYSMCINLFLQSFFRTISNIEEMYS